MVGTGCLFLFAKQAQTNITGAELHAFRKLAMQFGALSDDQVESLVVKKNGWRFAMKQEKTFQESGL